ncbi:tetratricopeptide repeat protein [Corallococcus sp. M34]|uniref:tetratricopeptide repeat protein n=1 Tax=Citreicoccus inhibens TaxID=2849499 RepID=UPI001C2462E0|nr:tetratricopeptide repeat protein [Citreicoccus inhibens]MBU8897806.1 tetratricopeptide repeat protein [Citreicoccus inhibens]
MKGVLVGFEESPLALALTLKDPTGEREARANLGRLHVRCEDSAAALPFLEQALANAGAHEDWLTVVEVLLDLGRAYALRGEPARAEAPLHRARALVADRGMMPRSRKWSRPSVSWAPRRAL